MNDKILETRDRASFERGVNAICNELVSVATNYTRQEDRPCLSASLAPDSEQPGYLITVRLGAGAPKYLEALAKDLHEGIQEYYRSLETHSPERLAGLAAELQEEVKNELG